MASPAREQPTAEQTQDAPTVEVDEDEADSAYGGDASTASTSLRTNVLKYEWKHGRRYHSYQAGSYSFPNDDQEQDRLDMIHHVYYRALNNRLFLAPIDPNGLKILDIGTGTGIWPIHVGDEHPEASLIVGNDLSAIQPKWTPPNVKFIVDDVELDWIETETYDYIHCRYMAGSIRDWPRLVRQIYDNLKPGGWVEFQESANTMYSEDGSLASDNMMVKMMDGLMEACDKIGRTLDPAPSMKSWAETAGFANVKEQRFKIPVGSWPKDPRLKEIGSFMVYNFAEGVEAFTAVLFKDVLGWSQEEIAVLNAGVRAAARRKDVHTLFDFLVITGQKPA
ncbi:S-adenosyl-L-methionine-dependent methyltransferase [Phialemonium atrogriseum]|uniref:S-adenosyl-L-methionine-dependent methyltransferase n=1 Tax=Phialemonium atrogriseum TaxID=1093897 RepID=A0AAJ0FGG9_9PEZI|nr:S-adenosyl-L-methionine-dependent methyltransferase [Phialemonium atrogriseum]KAK1767606.1 S-adenosyl-L-methionine-dependent methyltransferase [Phialemonium atrogriseum]